MKNILKSVNLKSFERKSSQRFIPEIDALRFFAIMPVMLVHFSGALLAQNKSFDRTIIDQENTFRHILLQGNFGVHLFFAISGFILTLPFLKKAKGSISLKKYFTRRLIRIEPPYIIAITIFLIVHLILQEKNFSFLLESYLASFFYVHNGWFDAASYILPVAWSLEIEVQFYLIMPILIFIVKFFDSPIWRAFIYLLLLLSSLYLDILPFEFLNDYMVFFLSGIIAADLYLNLKFNKSYIWDFIFLGCIITFFSTTNNPTRFICLIGVITSSFNVILLKKFLNAKLITVIGGMCYSLYLLHYPLFYLMTKVLGNKFNIGESFEWTYLIQASIFIPLGIMLMSIYFLLVEKPFMVLSQKMGKKNT
ncbi:acyltransferase family protein [uncultured Croceitalea sp.]|uniref:acyltransferase family protein n=1 Tax=uncultured Croceitalea sp. TaxID=1798908 RepID=UPI00374F9CB0